MSSRNDCCSMASVVSVIGSVCCVMPVVGRGCRVVPAVSVIFAEHPARSSRGSMYRFIVCAFCCVSVC